MGQSAAAELSLAAGSISTSSSSLLHVNRRLGYKTLAAWALLGGLFLGFATELVLEAAGA